MLSALCAGAAPDSTVQPDIEFLEFLGSWTTGDARPKWIDPFKITDLPNKGSTDLSPQLRQEQQTRERTPQSQPRSMPDPNRAGKKSQP